MTPTRPVILKTHPDLLVLTLLFVLANCRRFFFPPTAITGDTIPRPQFFFEVELCVRTLRRQPIARSWVDGTGAADPRNSSPIKADADLRTLLAIAMQHWGESRCGQATFP